MNIQINKDIKVVADARNYTIQLRCKKRVKQDGSKTKEDRWEDWGHFDNEINLWFNILVSPKKLF